MKIIVIIISSFLLLAGCAEKKVKPGIDKTINTVEIPAQESWNSTIFFTDSGNTKAILKTGHLQMFSKNNETLLDSGVIVDFYDEYEVKTTTLTSNRGRVDDLKKDLYAIDSVVAVSDSGVTLETDELMWRNTDQKIISDKFVTITTDKEKIEGFGFESDQGLRNYVIYNITYVTRIDTAGGK